MSVIVVAAAMAAGFLVQDGNALESLVLPFVVVVPTWLIGDVV